MAAKRSIPTSLFASPDFFELSSDTVRLILIGIILDADDEGRGSAHTHLLARKLDKTPQQIEEALGELAAHGILRCYQVQSRHYYMLCHWHKFQTLSKPTPSSFPAPPAAQTPEPLPAPPGKPTKALGNPGPSGPNSPEGEEKGRREGKENREEEPKRRGREAPGEPQPEPPLAARTPLALSKAFSLSAEEQTALPPPVQTSVDEQQGSQITEQVAQALQLPITDALTTLVTEFLPTTTFSLVKAAQAARAWIDDPLRNTARKPMSLIFFQRWLKRERGDYLAPAPSSARASSHTGTPSGRAASAVVPSQPPSLAWGGSMSRVSRDNPYLMHVLASSNMTFEQFQQYRQQGYL